MSDDWETDPDFVNDVTEKEQRWGSKTVGGSGHQESVDMRTLREEVKQSDKNIKLKTAPKPSYGYGGKFGVERDRMDKSAVGHDHVESVPKHSSQVDYSTGFGGKYGVQSDRQDRSAVGWDHKEHVEAHASQKDYTAGFGGKFGVQKDRQDKCAVGWDHKEQVALHASQKDYSVGFGGKFGVQSDRVDPNSANWDEKGSTELHPSQMRPAVSKPSVGLSTLRDRFEPKNKTTTATGPSPAQERVMKERVMWEAERQQVTEQQKLPQDQSGGQNQASSPDVGSIPVPSPPTQTQAEPDSTHSVSAVDSSSAPNGLAAEDNTTTAPPFEAHAVYYTAKALYDYNADEDDELTFSFGELITEVEKIDVGWWKGVCRGKVGLFPANYVEEL